MTIGTLTFHCGLNHGGYLQAYDLCAAIKNLCQTHNLPAQVEIIHYKNPTHQATDAFRPGVYRNPLNLFFNYQKNRAFQKAFHSLPLSSKHLTHQVNAIDWARYDAIVIGSDIVWNYESPSLGHDAIYFGKIPSSFQGKLIAYAPSCGSMPSDFQLPESIHAAMQRFGAIATRDANTRQFALRHSTCQSVPLVVDPTWLTTADRGLSSHKSLHKKYLLLYAYHVNQASKEAIIAYAKQHQLQIIATGYYQPFADKNLGKLTPFEWVDLYSHAHSMVAGTFHGALYAMREGVRFAVLPQEAINTKLKGPMAITGLHNHICDNADNLADILEHTPDKQCIDARIEAARLDSLSFLQNALFS